MPISDWEDMMPDTLLHYEYVSSDPYGKPTYGSPATINCRLTFEPTVVTNDIGEEVTSSAQAWLSSTSMTIDPRDKYETSFGDVLYPLTTGRIQDEDGVHHHKVFFSHKKNRIG
jgi:hypothetical protein